MWYHGFDGARWRIGYAEDADSNSRFGVTPIEKDSVVCDSYQGSADTAHNTQNMPF
jgi:hypothetical protein